MSGLAQKKRAIGEPSDLIAQMRRLDMGYVKKLYIDGLKRFEHFEIEFNECLSILVGENEAGKSTILEAIRIVLNQQYWNADKSVLQHVPGV